MERSKEEIEAIERAIAEETTRYVGQCRDAAACAERGTDHHPDACRYRRMAHIHLLAIKRLRHSLVTEHEALVHATPTINAFTV